MQIYYIFDTIQRDIMPNLKKKRYVIAVPKMFKLEIIFRQDMLSLILLLLGLYGFAPKGFR